jgi:GWxTD domain-containing protein
MKAKEQFRFAAYTDALATLDRLAAESEQPGNEAYRTQLRPGLAFYKGASLAALGRSDEARTELQLFLTYQPSATLDPGAYPAKVIAALDDARKGLAAETQKAPETTGSIATNYSAYKPVVRHEPVDVGEDWADSPVGYLLTKEQKRDFSRLSDSVSRSEFITEFWKTRDPKPETPENEARDEFDKRVAFADAQLSQDETRGSLTDRGMVFVLLGPPTWIGRRPIRTGEDRDDHSGMTIYSDQDISNILKGLSGGASAIAFDKMTGPSNRMPDADGNYREIWHYRREQLPAGVGYLQVDFDFLTRKGYGKNVMQRDDKTLATLGSAQESMRAGIVSRTASH